MQKNLCAEIRNRFNLEIRFFYQIFLKNAGRVILFGKVLKIVFEKTVIYFGDKCAGGIKPQLFVLASSSHVYFSSGIRK